MEHTKPNILARALNQSVNHMEKRPLGRVYGRINKNKKTITLFPDQIKPSEIEAKKREMEKKGYNVVIEPQIEETGNGTCGKLCHCQTRCQYL